MDTLGEDQALRAVLDRELGGIDNEALDFQIEDYINGDGSICLPDDLPGVSYGGGRVVAHSTASNDFPLPDSKPCSSSVPDLHPSSLPPHPLQHPHHNPHAQHQHLVHHPLSQQQHPHPHHQQQQQQQHHQQQQQQQQQCQLQPAVAQQQQQQQLVQSPNSMYCGIGQARVTFDHHQHYHQNNTPLPDSPPDSGSEPYSPQDDTPHSFAENQQKHSLAGTMPTVPQPLCPGTQHRVPALPDLGMGHKMPPAYLGGPEPPKLNHMPPGPQPPPGMGPHQMSPALNPHFLQPHFGSMNNLVNQPNKKRKFTESPTNTINASMLPPNMNGVLSIKQEPPGAALNQFTQYVGDCGPDDDFSYDLDPNVGFVDGTYQVIKWQSFNSTSWNALTDANFKDLPMPTYRVDADKGFNFSVPDEAFVCQKKNHFQVTVHVGLQGNPRYIRTPEGVKKIEDFYVHFYGVKVESPTQNIKIEQSQSDRSKKPFHPVKVDLIPEQAIKLTVGRLHFSETTSNNMRKKGKPNPDQRYFKLVVALHAQSGHSSYLICAHSSERIIVRASNPGQFDSEVDVMWQKGHTGDSVYHVGRVGVNTDHPEEAMTVHGNMRLTGHLLQPSDMRAKENIEELDPKNQLQNVQKMRIYRYDYKEEYAEEAGLPADRRHDAGVLAQEIIDVLPDAVQSTGDVRLASGHTLENFLVVNKDRIFMENVGAVKELCKLTDNLEVRIDELEKMNKRLSKLRRYDSIKSTNSYKSVSSVTSSTLSTTTATPPRKPSSTPPSNHHSKSSSGDGKKHSSSSRSHSQRYSQSQHSHRRSSSSTLSSFSSLPKMCGNRFLQITILILILIMAFCLVAITTLYIMERHKQNSDDSSPVFQATPAPSHRSSHPPIEPSSASSGNRSFPLGPQSTSPTTATSTTSTTTTTTATTTRKNSDRKTTTTTTVSIAPTSHTISTLPAYPIPSCQKEECEQLCCPLPPEDQPYVIPHGGGDAGPAYNTINDSGDGEEAIYTAPDDGDRPPLDTTAAHNHNSVVSMSQAGTTNNHYDNPNNIQLVVNGGAGPAYNIINTLSGGKYRHAVYKRQATNGAEDVRMVVKELNATITQGFCQSGCHTNNQSYYIPMAPLFGFAPITFQFRMNKSRHVALCNTQAIALCGNAPFINSPEPQTKNGTVVEWVLHVGVHVRTHYFFRVAEGEGIPDDNTSEICSLQPTSGLLIQDYRLQFARTCPNNNME